MDIILASASPRRKELLNQIGWEFTIQVSRVEEKITRTLAWEVVEELSAQKARDVFERVLAECTGAEKGAFLVIGADTVVSCDGKILGKPKGRADAVKMLKLLQGRTHQVYTGVALCYCSGGNSKSAGMYEAGDISFSESGDISSGVKELVFHEKTEVTFYPMTDEEIAEYIATGEPMDKAGAYGIQGLGARYISHITGDYGNVVGLPVGRLYQELRRWVIEEN